MQNYVLYAKGWHEAYTSLSFVGKGVKCSWSVVPCSIRFDYYCSLPSHALYVYPTRASRFCTWYLCLVCIKLLLPFCCEYNGVCVCRMAVSTMGAGWPFFANDMHGKAIGREDGWNLITCLNLSVEVGILKWLEMFLWLLHSILVVLNTVAVLLL